MPVVKNKFKKPKLFVFIITYQQACLVYGDDLQIAVMVVEICLVFYVKDYLLGCLVENPLIVWKKWHTSYLLFLLFNQNTSLFSCCLWDHNWVVQEMIQDTSLQMSPIMWDVFKWLYPPAWWESTHTQSISYSISWLPQVSRQESNIKPPANEITICLAIAGFII